MKKFKNGFLALALVAGVAAAFVPKMSAASGQLATYQWEKYNHDGTRNPSLDENASLAQAQADYNCSGAAVQCAVGTKDPGSGPGDDTIIIKFAN